MVFVKRHTFSMRCVALLACVPQLSQSWPTRFPSRRVCDGPIIKRESINNTAALIGMDTQTHWEKIYTEKAHDAVSWYRPHLETSLALIEQAAAGCSVSVIDVSGSRK